MIILNNVSFSYGNKLLFSGVNMYVMNGQVTTLFGSNGSGKSSLLDILIQEKKPHIGEIMTTTNFYKKIGYLSQKLDLWPHMTCEENIIFSLGKELNPENKNYLINLFELQSIMSKYPHQISLGQQQLIGIIRAILIDSLYLFFDEPTSAMDRNNFNKFVELMKDLKNQGKTIFIVTHDFILAQRLADKIYSIENKTVKKVRSLSEYVG